MIVTLILKLITMFVEVLTFLLPKWAIPDYIVNAFQVITDQISGLNSILPLQEILNVLVLGILFEIAVLFFRLLFGLISLVRGGGKVDL